MTKLNQLNPLYEKGDVKYFRNLHKERQAQMGGQALSYNAFRRRLERGMSLREAIYTPCNPNMRRNSYNMKPSKLHSLRIRFISFFKSRGKTEK